MAIPRIKATYSLDVDTVRALERVARRWQVSKSEALRRAIRTVAGDAPDATVGALAALTRAQKLAHLSPGRARAWSKRVRTERRSAASRRLPRER